MVISRMAQKQFTEIRSLPSQQLLNCWHSLAVIQYHWIFDETEYSHQIHELRINRTDGE